MKNKDTRKASASIAIATVSLLDAVDLFFMANLYKAPQIFASGQRKPLAIGSGQSLRGLRCHLSKILWRRMDRINES